MATKMTREEAINKVRQMNLPKETMEILQALAPELAESEDERIRKRLIEYFEGFMIGNTKVKWEGLTVQDVLAYLEKQKEQKPAEWSEEDERNIRNLESVLYYDKYLSDETRTKLGNFLKSLPNRLNRQPKTEWSEEDEKKLARVIWYVEKGCSMIFQKSDKLVFWLKSLRPSWKPSEQEKGALRTAIHVLTEERNFPKAAEHLQAILDAFEGKESRKDWKPSEEQMNALYNVINPCDYVDKKALESLYEQLKKL